MQTWVIRILINECHNILKRQKREGLVTALPERSAPADSFIDLHNALLALDETLRIPLVLHYIEDYSVNEIARILFIPAGTVKTRLMRGRKELASLLHEEVEG
ncbi:MAG: hypothetical protein FWE76_01680 [Symbiobacteriaceae bacterium]|nr:hypothetical protein [Symbiobacteriaceae bacterium]